MKSPILKIIVIDNDVPLHESYRYYFNKYIDYSLEGIYTSVENALINYEDTFPDIIVSEVALPQIDGIEGIRLFRRKDPEIKIIMISRQNDDELVKKAFKYGAVGYLSKPVGKKDLYRALNSIKYEGAAMSNDIAKKVISMFRTTSYHFFSERENQIIEYLFKGATYKVIADKLFVTPSTVNFHIQNIYLKLDVNSKSEALSKLQEMDHTLV